MPNELPAIATLVRSTADWTKIFETQTDMSNAQLARRIIGDLWGYDHDNKRYTLTDIEQLANALHVIRVMSAKNMVESIETLNEMAAQKR